MLNFFKRDKKMKRAHIFIVWILLGSSFVQCNKNTQANKSATASTKLGNITASDHARSIINAAQTQLNSPDCTGGRTNSSCTNAQILVSNPEAVSSAVQTIMEDPSGLNTIAAALTLNDTNSTVITDSTNGTDSNVGTNTVITSAKSGSSSSLSGGAIAGITLGSIVAAIVIGGAVVYGSSKLWAKVVRRLSDSQQQNAAERSKQSQVVRDMSNSSDPKVRLQAQKSAEVIELSDSVEKGKSQVAKNSLLSSLHGYTLPSPSDIFTPTYGLSIPGNPVENDVWVQRTYSSLGHQVGEMGTFVGSMLTSEQLLSRSQNFSQNIGTMKEDLSHIQSAVEGHLPSAGYFPHVVENSMAVIEGYSAAPLHLPPVDGVPPPFPGSFVEIANGGHGLAYHLGTPPNEVHFPSSEYVTMAGWDVISPAAPRYAPFLPAPQHPPLSTAPQHPPLSERQSNREQVREGSHPHSGSGGGRSFISRVFGGFFLTDSSPTQNYIDTLANISNSITSGN